MSPIWGSRPHKYQDIYSLEARGPHLVPAALQPASARAALLLCMFCTGAPSKSSFKKETWLFLKLNHERNKDS